MSDGLPQRSGSAPQPPGRLGERDGDGGGGGAWKVCEARGGRSCRPATLVPQQTLAAHDLPALHAAAIHKKSTAWLLAAAWETRMPPPAGSTGCEGPPPAPKLLLCLEVLTAARDPRRHDAAASLHLVQHEEETATVWPAFLPSLPPFRLPLDTQDVATLTRLLRRPYLRLAFQICESPRARDTPVWRTARRVLTLAVARPGLPRPGPRLAQASLRSQLP